MKSATEDEGWAELDRQLDQQERAAEPKMTDQEWAAYVDKVDRANEGGIMTEDTGSEKMTIEGINKDPWAAVQLPLPSDASPGLLRAAGEAAERAELEARHVVRTHDPEDVDSVGWAAEMRFMADQANERVGEIEDRLAAMGLSVAPVETIDRQYETPERSEWYRQTQAEHELDLGAPQRFPLTGDGLVTQRIVADGPFNGPDIGAELALARYRDWEFSAKGERQMPDAEADRMADTYWDNLVSRARQTEQNAQAYAVAQRPAASERPETELVERSPRLSL